MPQPKTKKVWLDHSTPSFPSIQLSEYKTCILHKMCLNLKMSSCPFWSEKLCIHGDVSKFIISKPLKITSNSKKIVNHTLDASEILHPLIWRTWESPVICKIFSTIPSVKRSTLNPVVSWSWLCTSTLSPPKVSWGQGRAPNQWKPQTMGCVPSKWPYLFSGKLRWQWCKKPFVFFGNL